MAERGEEFVLHAAGALGLGVRMLQALLELLALVDVGVGAEPAHDAALVVADRKGATEMPAVFAVVPAQRVFDLVGLAGAQGFHPALRGSPESLLGVHVPPVLEARGSLRQPRVLVPLAVEVVDVTLGRGGEHDLRHRVGKLPEARLALAQVAGDARALDRFPAAARHGLQQLDIPGAPDPGVAWCTAIAATKRPPLCSGTQITAWMRVWR